MRICFLGLMMLCFFMTGCSQDPMKALKSTSKESSLSYQFWSKQYDQNTPLWHEAVSYCLNNGDKPNCDFVMNIYMAGDGSKKPPKIGQSGESIHMELN